MIERGNLYHHDNINKADEKFQEKVERNFIQLIASGKNSQTPEERRFYRGELEKAIRTGNMDRSILRAIYSRFDIDADSDGPMRLEQIVNALIPLSEQVEASEMPVLHVDQVFLSTVEGVHIERGAGTFREKGKIPRTKFFTELLEQEGVDLKECLHLKGNNPKGTIRKAAYEFFIIPPLEKMALICNEEGNASFIVHTVSETPEVFYSMNKDQLMALKERGLVTKVTWPKKEEQRPKKEAQWLEEITEALTEKSKSLSAENLDGLIEEIKGRILQGQEKIEILENFFEALLMAQAFGFKNQTDYQQRYKEVPGLPSNPYNHYKNKGWKGWPDFLGYEPKGGSARSKLIVSLDEAMEIVREQGFRTAKEYKKGYKKVTGLPASPEKTYIDKGWTNWLDFLGNNKDNKKSE